MEIKTMHLILRKHKLEDFDRFWMMINDPIAKKYTGGVTQLQYSKRLELFTKDCNMPFSNEGVEFAVIEKTTGKYLGYCGFRHSEELAGEEFLYGYCQDSWGKGYGFEAARVTMSYLFKYLIHEQYIATAHKENVATVKILMKLGFKETSCKNHENNKGIHTYVINRQSYLEKYKNYREEICIQQL